MSLVGSVVAVGITGVVVMTTSHALSQIAQFQGHSRKVELFNQTHGTISSLINDVDYCSGNFAGISVRTNPNEDFRDINLQFRQLDANGNPFGPAVYQVGTDLGLGVQLQGMQYRTLVRAGSRLHGVLRVRGDLNSEKFTGSLYRDINISLLVDNPAAPNAEIQRCGNGRSLLDEEDPLASGPDYSENCANWSQAGWESRQDCLQDGRWHLVYHNGQGGQTLFGSIQGPQSLVQHIRNGASVRVVTDAWNSTEDCQNTYEAALSPGVVYCLTSMRFSGTAPPLIRKGAARYGTNGSIWCINEGIPGTSNQCNGLASGYRWYIKY